MSYVHVQVGVHVVDLARDLGQGHAHERLRSVDLALRDDRIALEVRDPEAGTTVSGISE